MVLSVRFYPLTPLILLACTSTTFAGGLSVYSSGTPQSNISVIQAPKAVHYRGKVPVLVSISDYTMPVTDQVEADQLTYQLLKNLKAITAHKKAVGSCYFLTINPTAELKNALLSLPVHYDVNRYQYSGLNGNAIAINRYAHLNYQQKKQLDAIRITNKGNVYFGYGFLIKPNLNKQQVALTLHYDSIKPVPEDALGLPSKINHRIQSTLPLKRGQASLIIWQRHSIGFEYHQGKQKLVPQYTLNVARIAYRFYPRYFQRDDAKRARLKTILDA